MASPEDGTTGLTEAESLRPAASPVSEKDSGHHALLVGKLARFVCSQECKTCSY